MTNPVGDTATPRQRWLRRWLAAVLEAPFSRRGLALGLFLLAAGLTAVCWLRPPLSHDLSAFDLPFRVGPATSASPEDILSRNGPLLSINLGTILFALAALGAVAVLWRPGLLGVAAGLLLGAALAANAVALFNFPALVETLDLEQEQRLHMLNGLSSKEETPPLTNKQNGRAHGVPRLDGRVSAAPCQDQEWGGLSRGWYYLTFSPYLVFLAGLGVLLGTAGSLPRRLAVLTLWVGLGLLMAIGACSRRLVAEYHWAQAKSLEARCEFEGSRQELQEAVTLFPEFRRLHRTWLLAGKLDYRDRRDTSEKRFFLASQYGLIKDWPRALALVNGIRPGTVNDNSAVRHQAARIQIGAGLQRFGQGRWAASQDFWKQASLLAPEGRDAFLLQAIVSGRVQPHQADPVAAVLVPLLGTALADQPLQADLLALLGSAWLQAGQVEKARRYFAESLDLFNMPRNQNLRAQMGLGGL
jgi:tetratricopeptide (TPR) repeat protein